MAKRIVEESWRNVLPEVYHWADRLRVDWPQAVQANQTYLVPVKFESDQNKRNILAEGLDASLQTELVNAWEKTGWNGKSGSVLVEVQSSRFILLPLLQSKTSEVQIARQFGMDTARIIKDFALSSFTYTKPKGLDDIDIFDGLCMGLYDGALFKGERFANQKKSPGEGMPEHIGFLGWKENAQGFARGKEMAKATALVRMLQDAPANWLTPKRFGDIAADVAKDCGLKCTLLGRQELEALGAGSLLSVTAGTDAEPRLIALEIAGRNPSKTVALIGKGLTFDSGGISLKPGLGMGEMKYDMSGGASVLGTAYFLGKVKPAFNVVCIIGAVENMPGPSATKPGDIVQAMNGKTIDVQNTDAEGRLVLADLLHYANITYKPEFMIDVATLTGAVLHALGHVGAAVMSNDQGLANQILEASKSVGEPFWQLPMWPEFEKEVKGDWSDLSNIAKPNVQAGTIIGAVFLAEFVGKTKWAHLDIAGTGWSCKATGFPASGGSSFALRTLSEICLRT